MKSCDEKNNYSHEIAGIKFKRERFMDFSKSIQ